MPEFAGLNFPTLPTASTTCGNWDFIDDNIGWSKDNSTLFNTAWQRCGELVSEVNFQISEGEISLNAGADILNNYKTYLLQGYPTLELWQHAYDDWANATGWSGWQNDASCNHFRNANEEAELYVSVIRIDFATIIGGIDYAISVLVAQEIGEVTSTEMEAYLAELENTIAMYETSTGKKKQTLNVIKFGNYVEYIAIGGAILILVSIGYKKLR